MTVHTKNIPLRENKYEDKNMLDVDKDQQIVSRSQTIQTLVANIKEFFRLFKM